MSTDNIKVGDYARNKKGIGKITEIKDHGEYVEIILDNFYDIIEYPNGKEAGTLRNKIVMRKGTMRKDIKIGKLIDLIEYGDIIGWKTKYNGGVNEVVGNKGPSVYATEEDRYVPLSEIEIVSIITHEKIQEMEYKIEK